MSGPNSISIADPFVPESGVPEPGAAPGVESGVATLEGSRLAVRGKRVAEAAPDRAHSPLVGMSRTELQDLVAGWGWPGYRGRQLARWIYERGVEQPELMSDLPAALRSRLLSESRVPVLDVAGRQSARDGTEKFLFGLRDRQAIETVVLPFEDRTSLCVSSQAGCPIRCTFCATGRSGYSRNLDVDEIVGQLLAARRLTGRRITHVVFMGMGEPLLNLHRVLKSARLMRDEMGVPMRHITLSTVGLVPEMRELADAGEPMTLAVSLHAPNDLIRQSLIPVARRYPLADILAACHYYHEVTGRRVTFEYVLLRDVNDGPQHAAELATLLRSSRSHVNLIPYNPGDSGDYHAPRTPAVHRFRKILESAGIPTTQRMEKGQEIMAACGQLRKQTLLQIPETGTGRTAEPNGPHPVRPHPIPSNDGPLARLAGG